MVGRIGCGRSDVGDPCPPPLAIASSAFLLAPVGGVVQKQGPNSRPEQGSPKAKVHCTAAFFHNDALFFCVCCTKIRSVCTEHISFCIENISVCIEHKSDSWIPVLRPKDSYRERWVLLVCGPSNSWCTQASSSSPARARRLRSGISLQVSPPLPALSRVRRGRRGRGFRKWCNKKTTRRVPSFQCNLPRSVSLSQLLKTLILFAFMAPYRWVCTGCGLSRNVAQGIFATLWMMLHVDNLYFG